MLRPVRLALAALPLLAAACSTVRSAPVPAGQSASGDRPALVVLLVVDQFRAPYFERYGDLFTGGLRRLMVEGRRYVNASHAHGLTETAVGHATLSTGVYPSRHGIVANEWAEQVGDRWVDIANVSDTSARIVGLPSATGVSPHRLARSGFAEWLQAAEPGSQVASVSGKDRGAVLPAAHAKGHVYWFDPRAGRFVTSDYYRTSYPSWAEEFTAREMPRFARDSVWASRIPAQALSRASADSVAWEGDGVHTSFPHRFASEGRAGRYWDWFASTPMLDAATLAFARTMVTSLGLGRDATPDFLNVSLSQTDRVGHAYGPASREQLDNLLRLDRELGEFFAFLDRTVGVGRWAIAMSADHGSAMSPEVLPQPGEPTTGRRATAQEREQLRAIREAAARVGPDSTAAALRRLPFVAEAYTHERLLRSEPADSFAVLVRRSLYPGRAGADFSPYGVEVRFIQGWLSGARGTSHGTPYWYDRHVPIVFMGPGIAPGADTGLARTIDVAPTLAALAGVPAPSDLDGRPLPSVVRAAGQVASLAGSAARDPQLPSSVRWFRSSAERRAIFLQTYRSAEATIARLATGQPAGSWAVILDADETVLDNSPYEVEIARRGAAYDSASWDAWVRREAAPVLPGARSFTERVRALGGRVVIVTNRDEPQCPATRANLRKVGIEADAVLCKTDPASSSKDPRFDAVANGTAPSPLPALRVLMWVGDNIQDFPQTTQAIREAGDERFAPFGERFIVLPNPMYGSWEKNPVP